MSMLKLLYIFTKQVKHGGRVYKRGESEYFHTRAKDAFLAVHGADSLDGPYGGEEILAGGKGAQFMDKNKSISAGKVSAAKLKATTVSKVSPERTEEEQAEIDKLEEEALESKVQERVAAELERIKAEESEAADVPSSEVFENEAKEEVEVKTENKSSKKKGKK